MTLLSQKIDQKATSLSWEMNGSLHLSLLSSLVPSRERGQCELPERETTGIKG